jgi:exodeoxyribonuclease V alpha subunit
VVLALAEHNLLRAFNAAGVLAPADVHVAVRLAQLGGDGDELVALATALAVRAPRVGHVHVDLAAVRSTAAADLDDEAVVDALPWPAPVEWTGRVASSPLVAQGEQGAPDRPFRLVGSALYLDRYWRDEVAVAKDMLARARASDFDVDEAVLGDGLARLFPGEAWREQREAATVPMARHFSVIAGGPGTGKTTTVARLLALLELQADAAGVRPPLVALTAPTGKAAARMAEAVRSEARSIDVPTWVRERLVALGASTLHRLLVRHPANASRFRYDRSNQLPHDVVIVDETSMVPLWLMARLLEAVRTDARLVLLGDPDQLASVEAGAVLGDIVGPASGKPTSDARPRPGHTGVLPPPAAPGLDLRDCIAVLRANHRSRGAMVELAGAVRAGDADQTVAVLTGGAPTVKWLQVDVSAGEVTGPAWHRPLATGMRSGQAWEVREAVASAGKLLVEAALAGCGAQALAAMGRSRVLCAHRLGPAGASTWNALAEGWLAAEVEGFLPVGGWYTGRPVIVTANDYSLHLFNGDAGIAVAHQIAADQERLAVVFDRPGGPALISPSRLSDVATAFAMTIHKAQGSEFDEVIVVLPAPTSRILTRELLYTAITRARQRLVLVGTEGSVRAAVSRPVARASGLTARLWDQTR